jgi:hypothetical protein
MGRRKPPHPLRFMKGALWGMQFIFIGAVILPWIMTVVCARLPTCPTLPGQIFVVCYTLGGAGILFSLYRLYRDYGRGEFYIDSGHV